VAREPWPVAREPWPVAREPWPVAREPWSGTSGKWPVNGNGGNRRSSKAPKRSQIALGVNHWRIATYDEPGRILAGKRTQIPGGGRGLWRALSTVEPSCEFAKPLLERNRSAVGKSQPLGEPASALLCSCFVSAVACPDRPSCPRDQSTY